MAIFNLQDDSFHTDTDDDDDDDAALLAEIHALSNTCLHTVEDPSASASAAATTNNQLVSFAAESSDSDADYEFLRDIQNKYGAEYGGHASPRPNSGTLMVNSNSDVDDDDDDDDDDLEYVRAIKRRFGQYEAIEGNGGRVGDLGGMSSGNDEELSLPVDGIVEDRATDEIEGSEGGLYPVVERLDTVDGNGGVLMDFEQQTEVSGLSTAEAAFIDVIRKNRLDQRRIREEMMKIEERREKVMGAIKRVRVMLDFDVQGRKKMSLMKGDGRTQLIAVRSKDKKVASVMRKGPCENSRVVNYRRAFDKYPQWICKQGWTKGERGNLKKGIIQQVQKWLLHKSMERMEECEEGGGCADGVDDIMSKIVDLDVNAQTIRLFLPNVDWDDVASTYLPKRSGRECLARWMNFEDPLISFGEWTSLEDKSLLFYIQQRGHNWVSVAEDLGTGRTPFQCLVRYQRSLNASLIKRDWTSDEDARLTSAVQTYGESNWTVVASLLEGRTGPQCSNRWLKTLLPSKQKKGRWNPDEDKRLKIAVMLIGSKSWNKIAEFVPGRTQARCRDRWVNSLDPSLNFGKWADEEDAKLEEAIRVHGYCWAKVATCVPPRTDSQCRRRWQSLFPEDAVRAQAERKVAKVALPSNFVDREPNRSSLRATDFIPLALGNTDAEDADCLRKGKKRATRRKKSCKISNTVFCNIPKKPRSRRCRRVNIGWEVPVIHHSHSSVTTDTLPSQRRRARGSVLKRNKHAEPDSTLADLKNSLKGAHKKRKGRENETIRRCKHAEVEFQRESSVNRDDDAGSVCTGGSVVKGKLSSGAELDGSSVLMGGDHQEEYSGSELVNGSGDETIASLREVTRKQSKRRKLDHVEPEEWEDAPLARLFGKTVKLRKRKREGTNRKVIDI